MLIAKYLSEFVHHRAAVVASTWQEPDPGPFEDEAGRQGHLQGPIAKALMAAASEMLARPPAIEPIEVLGLKNVG